jgi:hypothetical protein
MEFSVDLKQSSQFLFSRAECEIRMSKSVHLRLCNCEQSSNLIRDRRLSEKRYWYSNVSVIEQTGQRGLRTIN